MNINIIAPNHPHQEKLRSFYNLKLEDEYSKLSFISRVALHVKTEKDSITEIGIELFPRGGKSLYVSDSDPNETRAFKGAISKMRTRIQKYKDRIVQNHKVK